MRKGEIDHTVVWQQQQQHFRHLLSLSLSLVADAAACRLHVLARPSCAVVPACKPSLSFPKAVTDVMAQAGAPE
jgi:hypothetical protein